MKTSKRLHTTIFWLHVKLATLVVVTLIGVMSAPVAASYTYGPEAGDFTYLGAGPTKWEPGLNTATVHAFVPPAGPMAPGGANWSPMPTGTMPDPVDDPHGGGLSLDIEGLVTGAADGLEYGIFNAAFNVWAAAAAITNLGIAGDIGLTVDHPNAHPGTGFAADIRVGAFSFDGPGGTLAHGYQPGVPGMFAQPTLVGDIHFDHAEDWVDNLFDVAGNGQYDFFTVALHELGHALGLGHSAVAGSVMWPTYGGALRVLGPDDTAGIRAIYDIPEPITVALLGLGSLGMIRRRRKA